MHAISNLHKINIVKLGYISYYEQANSSVICTEVIFHRNDFDSRNDVFPG